MCAELLKQMNIKRPIDPIISALMSSLVKTRAAFSLLLVLNTREQTFRCITATAFVTMCGFSETLFLPTLL